jgi:hypothetical protein
MDIAIEFNPSAFKHGISEAYYSLAEEHTRRLLWQE